jgi:hypothetical protein
VGNNPVAFIDPLGLEGGTIATLGTGAAVTGGTVSAGTVVIVTFPLAIAGGSIVVATNAGGSADYLASTLYGIPSQDAIAAHMKGPALKAALEFEAQRQAMIKEWMRTHPDFEPKPLKLEPKVDCPPPVGQPKRDCQAQWEVDVARIVKIAEEMRRRGYTGSEIGRWVAGANARALGRKQRCEDRLPATLPPYPAPWE